MKNTVKYEVARYDPPYTIVPGAIIYGYLTGCPEGEWFIYTTDNTYVSLQNGILYQNHMLISISHLLEHVCITLTRK